MSRAGRPRNRGRVTIWPPDSRTMPMTARLVHSRARSTAFSQRDAPLRVIGAAAMLLCTCDRSKLIFAVARLAFAAVLAGSRIVRDHWCSAQVAYPRSRPRRALAAGHPRKGGGLVQRWPDQPSSNSLKLSKVEGGGRDEREPARPVAGRDVRVAG